MNKYSKMGAVFGLLLISFNAAAILIIDDALDTYSQPTNDTGTFSTIAGYQAPSSPGQIFEVLTLQTNGSETGSLSHSMSSLVNTLINSGLSSPITSLVFGFGMNEQGNVADQDLTITDLTLTFVRPSSPNSVFSLNTEDINVVPFNNSGGSSSEAIFEIDLGFDFLSEYNAGSTELFTIAATINDTSAGAERFFLDGGLTRDANVVPVPAAVWLFGSALLGLAGFKRSKSKA